MQERSVFHGRYRLIYRENLDQPRDVNADITDWDMWLNRAWAETVLQRDRFPRQYEMIRQQDPMRLGGSRTKFELYDLATNPHEMTNLAQSSEHATELEWLCGALHNWAEGTEDRFFYWACKVSMGHRVPATTSPCL